MKSLHLPPYYFKIILGVLAFNFMLQSCNNNTTPDPLYAEMGGLDSISGIVDQWIVNIQADTILYPHFETVLTDSIACLNMRNHMVDQCCALAGGPCVYKGRTMRNTHAGMMITSDEFEAVMINLSDALIQKGITGDVRDRFMVRIQALELQIVGQ